MTREIATYIREFEDYRDGYDDIPAPISIEEEKEIISKSVSSLEKRTLDFSIAQERTDKKTFGVEGGVYRRTLVVSKLIDGNSNLEERNLINDASIELGYQKVGL